MISIYIEVLLLLLIANGGPILAKKIFADRFNLAIDFNLNFFDQRPVFGHSKTFRGVITSVLLTSIFALTLGYSVWIGFGIALTAMFGDLFSSFIKRRLDMAPSSMALGLDQIPESLLPLLFLTLYIEINYQGILLLVGCFFILELLLSRLLYWLHIRNRPY